MIALAQAPVHSELDLERYLLQMDEPDQVGIPTPGSEQRNPLNESFEDKCELTEPAKRFLESLGSPALTKIQRFVFNQLFQQKLVLFRKVVSGATSLPLCLSVLYRLTAHPDRIILVYRNETKATAYLNQLKQLSPALKTQTYLSPLNSMILNDKRAVQKPYRLMGFSLPRLVNLVNHKSVELGSVGLVLFLEVDLTLEAHPADFESFVNTYRQKGRQTQLGFVAKTRLEETSSVLGDYFGGLTSFENKTP